MDELKEINDKLEEIGKRKINIDNDVQELVKKKNPILYKKYYNKKYRILCVPNNTNHIT